MQAPGRAAPTPSAPSAQRVAATGLPQAPGRAAPTPSAPSAQRGELFARRGCDEPKRGARHHARRRGRVLAQADASAGREPGNQNWCREHAPGPRVGPGSGGAGGTQMLGGRRPIPPPPADPKMSRLSFPTVGLWSPDPSESGSPLTGPTMMTRRRFGCVGRGLEPPFR